MQPFWLNHTFLPTVTDLLVDFGHTDQISGDLSGLTFTFNCLPPLSLFEAVSKKK